MVTPGVREFELINRIGDEQRGLRRRQSRYGKQSSEFYAAAPCVVVRPSGRSGSNLDGLVVSRMDSQDCFDHRASRKRQASRKCQPDRSGRVN
ncbi:hypothetical protein RDE2_16010 [Rhodococcus sp. RDE2]|uniref:Uncharacterized protein n=1 Tax=Rhodococcus rhodochrous J45 TaxID=935266 RepID=A0A562E471_RHORH|nr:hypothetical protein L618_002200000310 [Rhodococcus rhodochrous J45]BDB59807.1 hypothetical protein RDE2_16010 [Rhodococcus sp. RDE2]